MPLAPAGLERRNHLRLAQHRMPGLVGIEHDRAQVAKAVRDHAFAARNAADKAEDEHGMSEGQW